MANIPVIVKVGPIDYQVKEVDGLRSDDGKWLHGDVNWFEFLIRVSTDHTDRSRFVTLWHEVLHVIETQYGFVLTEQQITCLATGIVQVMQDNNNLNWTEYNG